MPSFQTRTNRLFVPTIKRLPPPSAKAHSLHRASFLVSALVCVSTFFLAATVLAEAAASRTLKRHADPVIVTGAKLGPLLGSPLEHIGCLAAVADSLRPIPCQIDERTSDGEFIFTKGPDANLEDSDKVLSEQDELVFMAGDVGGHLEHPVWPEGFKKGLELEIADPLKKGTGYLYLAAFDRKPRASNVDYVTYTPGREEVEGSSYILGFSKKAPIIFDKLILKKSAGGSGDNPVDRMKIRLSATVWNTFTITKTEDDYTSKMIGYIDGPVRILRRTRNRVVLFWKIPSPSAIQDNYFYPDFFEFPVVVSLPMDMDTFLSDAHLRISVDLKGDPKRAYISARNPTPAILDGSMSQRELDLDPGPAEWSVVYGTEPGEEGGLVNRLSISANTPLAPTTYYVDDSSKLDPPEETPGQVGDLGYEIKNLKGLTKGTHLLTSVLYCFPKYRAGIEKEYLAIKDAPLTARMTREF